MNNRTAWEGIMLDSNPYQTPKTETVVDWRCRFLRSELVATAIAIACSLLLGGAGSFASRRMSFPPGEAFAISSTLLYCLVSTVGLAGRMPGDLLCGVILGANVRRPQVWWVLGGIVGYLFIATLFTRFLGHLSLIGGRESVPLLAVLAMDLARMGLVPAYVALGIVAGRRVVGLHAARSGLDMELRGRDE